MKVLKKANHSDINVGRLEFRERPEDFEKLGRLVWDVLNRFETKRVYLKVNKTQLKCNECIVHST